MVYFVLKKRRELTNQELRPQMLRKFKSRRSDFHPAKNPFSCESLFLEVPKLTFNRRDRVSERWKIIVRYREAISGCLSRELCGQDLVRLGTILSVIIGFVVRTNGCRRRVPRMLQGLRVFSIHREKF